MIFFLKQEGVSMLNNDIFKWEDEVRDNEVDLQGVVNNANYFIYMAHARHKHLKELGIDFSVFHEQGYNLLLIQTNMNFKDSLRSGDIFIITSKLEAEGKIRLKFTQEVIRKSDQKVVTTAEHIGTCIFIETKRPKFPEALQKILGL